MDLELTPFDGIGYVRAVAALPDRVNTQDDDDYWNCLKQLARDWVNPSFAFLVGDGRKPIVGVIVDHVDSDGDHELMKFYQQNKTAWIDAFPVAELSATKSRNGRMVEYEHGISGKDMLEAWMRLPERRRFDSFCYAPPGYDLNENARLRLLNSYRGPGVSYEDAVEATPDYNLEHPQLRHFYDHLGRVCGHHEELMHHVTCFLAHLVQYPGKKMRLALIFSGEEGSGKGSISDCVIRIIGDNNCNKASLAQFLDKFCAPKENCVALHVEECDISDAKFIERLKDHITGKKQGIEKKRIDCDKSRPIANLILNMNPSAGGAIPIHGGGPRRWLYCKCTNEMRDMSDKDQREVRIGLGLDLDPMSADERRRSRIAQKYIARYLYEFDVSGWDQKPPYTEAIHDAVVDTLKSTNLDGWWMNILTNEHSYIFDPECRNGDGGYYVFKTSILELARKSVGPALSAQKLCKELTKFLGLTEMQVIFKKRAQKNGKVIKERAFILPPYEDCVRAFAKYSTAGDAWAEQCLREQRAQDEDSEDDLEDDLEGEDDE